MEKKNHVKHFVLHLKAIFVKGAGIFACLVQLIIYDRVI